MAGEKTRDLTADEKKELERAKATIKRLEGFDPVAPDPNAEVPVLKNFRVLLHGVTWNEKSKQFMDNTTKRMVHDPKTGRSREVVIDRAIVTAYNTAEAWQKFCQSWGITQSDFAGSVQYREVRNLTEDEKLSPPDNVIEPTPNVMVGVPAPICLPIRADGEFNRPVPSPMVAMG